MSYNSTMDCSGFTSKFTSKELTDMNLEYVRKLGKERRAAGSNCISDPMEYEFITYVDSPEREKPGDTDIYPNGIGTHQKNYDTDELAVFIANHTLCATRLWFVGEGGERWGYYIYPGMVYAERIVRGDIEYCDPSNPLVGATEPVEVR